MIEHPLPIREPSLVENPVTDGLLMPKRRPHAGWDRGLGESARPGTIDLIAVALKAECMVTIPTNLTAISESGFPFLTRRAQGPETLRPTVAFARHVLNLQTSWGSVCCLAGAEYSGSLTGRVIREMFALWPRTA